MIAAIVLASEPVEVIEIVASRSYAPALKDRIFKPAGMTDMGCHLREAILDKRAASSNPDDFGV